MSIKYEKPDIEITLFYSLERMANEGDADGPSGVEEGYEKWPEN